MIYTKTLKTGIYKITSPIGKVYIGQSTNIEKRFISYRTLNCTDQSKIYNSLKKYNPNNHIFEILELCDESKLDELEIQYIKEYNSCKDGLNIRHGGRPKLYMKTSVNYINNSIEISKKYDLIWKYQPSPNYQFTQDGKCINTHRGKEVKRILVGYTEGFCLNGKFKSLKQIRKELVKIENIDCPF